MKVWNTHIESKYGKKKRINEVPYCPPLLIKIFVSCSVDKKKRRKEHNNNVS